MWLAFHNEPDHLKPIGGAVPYDLFVERTDPNDAGRYLTPEGSAPFTERREIIKVREHNGSQDYDTNYAYDPLGRLLNITNAKNQPTTLAYDTLGRKTSLDVPQMGAWSYSYDANGNIISQTDAKGQTTNMDYDRLGRLTFKTYQVDGAGIQITGELVPPTEG